MTATGRRVPSAGKVLSAGRVRLSPPPQGNWLVADIGGTSARFSLWSPESGLAPASNRTYRNDDFPDLAAVVEAFRKDTGSRATQAILAVAAPVSRQGSLPLTNRDWRIDIRELTAASGLSRLCLVNDLVAAGSGIESLRADELETSPGRPEAGAPILVIGIGTGLGAALVLAGRSRSRALASEAGHMTAAPGTQIACEACKLVAREHGRASWERLLSGPGLALFDAVERSDGQPDLPARIAERARAGDPGAARAAWAFARTVGEFSGDLCLALCAWGGVYFTGGVLRGLGSAFDRAALREGFVDKGRLSARLRSVPLLQVLAGDLAARGLGRLLAGEAEAPIVQS